MENQHSDKLVDNQNDTKERRCFETPIKWVNVFLMLLLHSGALFGFFLMITQAKIPTILFWYLYGSMASLGITAGAHRLWSHKAYKARLPLRIFLMLANTISYQMNIYTWCRDHRVHHKFSETDSDPHNSRRGFFFAHIGWLLCKKHPAVREKGATVDLSDVLQDPVVYWQRKFYFPLVFVLCFYLPTMLPVWWWQESLSVAFYACLYRYCYQLHCTWLVNSVAHFYGMQTYDSSIQPRESSLVVYSSYGEGYHNYHHTLPRDYSASELGWRHNFNLTTLFIDACALVGQAYDLHKPTKAMIRSRIERTGKPAEHQVVHTDRVLHRFKNFLIDMFFGLSHLWFPLGLRLIIMAYQ